MLILPLLLALQTQIPADAYADPRAKELVQLARTRRETVDRSITSYRVTAKERIGVGIRALRRDRMLFRREFAVRIHWFRDSMGTVEVLGARQSVPAAVPKPEIPEDLKDAVTLAFDPAAAEIMFGWSDSAFIRHPLAPGGESDYQFASGDSTTITFADGRTMQLYELRVTARRPDFKLVNGSFWIESQTSAVVRALLRPARPFDFERDIEDSTDDVPRFVKPIRAEVRYMVIEYGLWDRRWWLPRLMAFDMTASAANLVTTPLRFERLYENYEVEGDTSPHYERRERVARLDSAGRAKEREECKAKGEDVECDCSYDGRCHAYRMVVPADSALMLISTELPAAFIGMGDSMIAQSELGDMAQALGELPPPPWQLSLRPPKWGLFRYNRVEALSLGARQEIDLGRLRLEGEARIGVADWEPEAQFSVLRETSGALVRLRGYRRLAEMDPMTNGLGLGNSIDAFFFGRDDGEYFRTTGAELRAEPGLTRVQSWQLRLFAERQRAVAKETDFSIPDLLGTHQFRSNLPAQPADQFGFALTARASRPLGATGATIGSDVVLDASGGDFDFVRGAITLRGNASLGGLAVAAEVAGGTSAGTVPLQSLFYLGGPQTLRGYGGTSTGGAAFWRARAEIASRLPAARIALFTDVGKAGDPEQLSLRHPLIGVGVGVSFLDGLFRIDVSRSLIDPPDPTRQKGWRIDFYTDGIL